MSSPVTVHLSAEQVLVAVLPFGIVTVTFIFAALGTVERTPTTVNDAEMGAMEAAA